MTETAAATSFDTAYTTQRVVQPHEIDELGHVNNAVYVQWLQDIAVEHWHRLAPPEIAERYVWVCHRHEIDYRAQLLEGETVEVRTWVGEWSGAKFNRHVDVRKAGEAKWSVQAVTTWVMLDRESRRPKRIDDKVLAYFR